MGGYGRRTGKKKTSTQWAGVFEIRFSNYVVKTTEFKCANRRALRKRGIFAVSFSFYVVFPTEFDSAAGGYSGHGSGIAAQASQCASASFRRCGGGKHPLNSASCVFFRQFRCFNNVIQNRFRRNTPTNTPGRGVCPVLLGVKSAADSQEKAKRLGNGVFSRASGCAPSAPSFGKRPHAQMRGILRPVSESRPPALYSGECSASYRAVLSFSRCPKARQTYHLSASVHTRQCAVSSDGLSKNVRPRPRYLPVEPKPPSPRTVSESSCASSNSAVIYGTTTSCAIRSPGSTV